MDMARENGLIYEGLIYDRTLREEIGLETMADIYVGRGHVWWHKFPQLAKSKEREADSVKAVGWLLGREA